MERIEGGGGAALLFGFERPPAHIPSHPTSSTPTICETQHSQPRRSALPIERSVPPSTHDTRARANDLKQGSTSLPLSSSLPHPRAPPVSIQSDAARRLAGRAIGGRGLSISIITIATPRRCACHHRCCLFDDASSPPPRRRPSSSSSIVAPPQPPSSRLQQQHRPVLPRDPGHRRRRPLAPGHFRSRVRRRRHLCHHL